MSSSSHNPKIRRGRRLLVLGIGHLLFTDDGIGIHIVRELRKQRRATVAVREIGTAILEAVPLLAWADRVLVVDAMQAGGKPGTMYWGELSAMVRQDARCSTHDLDLASALDLIPREVARPEVFVLGVEPESLDLGLGLSQTLQATMPHLAAIIDDVLRGWRAERAHHRLSLPRLTGLGIIPPETAAE
jgi:hydrogenase maturation protease